MQSLVCLWRCYLCNTLVSTSIVMQSDFEYISLNHLHFCSPQISSRLKAVRSTGSDAAGGASSHRAAGLHPGNCHGGRTQLGDLCPLRARPLFTDWQTGLPSHPHTQLQRHPLLPQLAGSIDQVQIHAHMVITEWVDMSRWVLWIKQITEGFNDISITAAVEQNSTHCEPKSSASTIWLFSFGHSRKNLRELNSVGSLFCLPSESMMPFWYLWQKVWVSYFCFSAWHQLSLCKFLFAWRTIFFFLISVIILKNVFVWLCLLILS